MSQYLALQQDHRETSDTYRLSPSWRNATEFWGSPDGYSCIRLADQHDLCRLLPVWTVELH